MVNRRITALTPYPFDFGLQQVGINVFTSAKARGIPNSIHGFFHLKWVALNLFHVLPG